VHPIGETRWEQVSVGADDVCPDPQLGDGLFRTELVRQADAGVQRNRLPDRSDPRFLHPMVTQEARRRIGTVDFEALIAVGGLGDTEVVEDAAEEYQLVVIVDIAFQPLGCGKLAGEQVTAKAVIGDECGRGVEYELFCRAGDVGIWKLHSATLPDPRLERPVAR
jgi:hypothetical protein